MGRIAHSLLRLAALTAGAAWLADRWLRQRSLGAPPAPIRSTVLIAAPIERAWALLADIERQPEWMHDLKSVRLTTPPPVGVGTRGIGRVRVFGIGVEDPVEITAFQAPVHFAIRHEGLVTGEGDIRLTSGPDDTTTVTWDEALRAPVLAHVGTFVLRAVFGPIFRRDLERLAVLAEAD